MKRLICILFTVFALAHVANSQTRNVAYAADTINGVGNLSFTHGSPITELNTVTWFISTDEFTGSDTVICNCQQSPLASFGWTNVGDADTITADGNNEITVSNFPGLFTRLYCESADTDSTLIDAHLIVK
jgi:hypothetical protein